MRKKAQRTCTKAYAERYPLGLASRRPHVGRRTQNFPAAALFNFEIKHWL